MTTIHDSLMKLKHGDTVDVNDLIYPQLIVLLKHVFDIDLANVSNPFIEVSQVVSNTVCLDYTFEYGTVSVSTLDTSSDIAVTIVITDINISNKMPYKAKSCDLILDHDMNFKMYSFNISLEFSKSTLDSRLHNGEYSLLNINTVVFKSSRVVKTFSYVNKTMYSVPKNLKSFGLSANFFTLNNEFDNFLIDFLTCCSKTPEQFYEEFTEYPHYDKLISTVEGTVQLLEILKKQYTDDKELLKSRLLLTEMCLI